MIHFKEIEQISPLKIPFVMKIFKETFKDCKMYSDIDEKLKILAEANLPYPLILDGVFDIIDVIEQKGINWYNKNQISSLNRLTNFIEWADSTINETTIFTTYRKKLYEEILTSFFKTFGAKNPMKCHDLLHGYIKPEEV